MKVRARYWLTPDSLWRGALGDSKTRWTDARMIDGRSTADPKEPDAIVDIEPTPPEADSYEHARGAFLVVGFPVEDPA